MQYDITPITGSINWQSNIDTLGQQLSFEVAFNDDRFFPKNPVDLGSLMVLTGASEILRAIVIKEDRQGRGAIKYTAFDYAFYLNKSKNVYQFTNLSADAAINKVTTDMGVSIGSIATMSTPITKIYKDNTGADVMKDILDQVFKATGIKYRMEMREGKLFVEKQEDKLIQASFKLFEAGTSIDVMAAISSPSRSRSIEEMRNSIKIVSGDDKSVKIVGEAKDDALIAKYGLLQDVQNVEDKDIAQANQTAQNQLKELGKIAEENGIDCPGDDAVRAGRLIVVTEQVTGMSGKYLIKDVAHTVRASIHTMHLGLGVV